jgi:hypothetical protein
MGTVLHFRTINQTTEPKGSNKFNMAKSKLRQLVGLPWAADSCPWVGKLRTVLRLKNRVIRDSAVQLGLTHQRGAIGVDSSPAGVMRERHRDGKVAVWYRTVGTRVGEELTRPFRDARRFPSPGL